MLGIYRVDAQLVASRAVLSSTESVSLVLWTERGETREELIINRILFNLISNGGDWLDSRCRSFTPRVFSEPQARCGRCGEAHIDSGTRTPTNS
jgi:hypothetical protein